jgi:hypothetical protein
MQDRMDRQDPPWGAWTGRTDGTDRTSWTASIFDPAINDVPQCTLNSPFTYYQLRFDSPLLEIASVFLRVHHIARFFRSAAKLEGLSSQ